MNDYITLDSKKYKTVHKQWAPLPDRPLVIKRLLSGGRNVTFGPSLTNQWTGLIQVVASSPASGYGTIDDLRATYAKLSTLTFIDHYGTSHTIVMDKRIGEQSLSPKWDAASNYFQVNVTLVEI